MKRTCELMGFGLVLSVVLSGCHFGLYELLGKRPEGGDEVAYSQATCYERAFGESSTTSDASGCAAVDWSLKGVLVPEDNVVVIQVGKLSDQTYPVVKELQYMDSGVENGPKFYFECAPPAENPDRMTANIRCTGPSGTRIRAAAQEPTDVSLWIDQLRIAHSTCYNAISYWRAERYVLCGTGAGPGSVNGIEMPPLWRDVP